MPYPVSATQLLGQTIDNGTLRIEVILGAGAFNVVYCAVNIQSGAYYAVKCVEKAHSDYYQTRETQLHSQVSSHPHVLTFHHEINVGKYAFFVYDLCAGDLHSVITKLTFQEDELIKRIFIQIINALEYCYSHGVYHPDLKPENILVSSKSREFDVFIADFGLVMTSKMTASSCGTPCFMSPGHTESLVPHHHPYSTVEGDIWAFGCILAEMIANVRPWSLASPDDKDYSNFLVDCTILYDTLPISDAAHTLFVKIFSPWPECRPSLAAIWKQVLTMDTFFLSDREAVRWGWTDQFEKKLQWKMTKLGMSTTSSSHHPSEETSSGSFYSGTSSSSSASCYSCGSSSSASCYSCSSSSSAFESISLESESSLLPLTLPAQAVQVFCTVEKVPSCLDLGLQVTVAQST